jgi:hypothetical protein
MKNKLLLSTALISGLISGSAAMAQTTVTGSLALEYRAQSFDGANSGLSTRGFGRESQINVQNKGKLNKTKINSKKKYYFNEKNEFSTKNYFSFQINYF